MGKEDLEKLVLESKLEGEKSSSVGVVVSDDKLSRMALKWAVDHLPFKDQAITLISISPMPSQLIGFNDTPNTPEPDEKQDELSPPLRAICESRNLKWGLATLQVQDNDAAKALVKYVLKHKIERLVLGSSSKRSNLSRLFLKNDMATSVLRGAPDFCTVYVISKGRVTAMRPAVRLLRPLSEDERLSRSTESSIAPIRCVSGIPRNRSYDERSARHSDVSHGSSGRLSIDSMFSALCDVGSQGMYTQRLGKSSTVGSSSSFDSLMSSDTKLPYMSHSADELSSGEEESRVKSRPLKGLDDMEDKMTKLEMEMKQTMDMYHAACKQALREQQKVEFTHSLVTVSNLTIRDARRHKIERNPYGVLTYD